MLILTRGIGRKLEGVNNAEHRPERGYDVAVSRLVALLTLSIVLFAGCGGDASREEFQQDVVDARDRVDAGLQQVTTATSFDDLLDRLEIAAVETRKAATEMKEADAPSSLKDDKRAFESSLRTLSEEILETVETLDAGFTHTAPIARGISFESWNAVQSELASLRKAGIEVQPLARHGNPPSG